MPDGFLSLYELPQALVRPALSLTRGFNTLLDSAFYDVPTLLADLRERGERVGEGALNAGPSALDLGALADPEGSILVVDPERAPYVSRFAEVPDFLAWRATADPAPEVLTITGVGSSALGSAALAWNVAKAAAAPVIAIVPGYGLADVALQGLGGFFGFGLYEAFGVKSALQSTLAMAAPPLAWPGRQLAASSPDAVKAPTGAPVFQYGGGASDVLHALARRMPIKLAVGHSKGALAVANGLRSLGRAQTEGMTFITLGCPVRREIEGVTYRQFLGLFDALGWVNSWLNPPTDRPLAAHTTNTTQPLCLEAQALVAETIGAPRPPAAPPA